MSFNKYYNDELSFLREMGKEYAGKFPEAGRFLAEEGTDPDVERLLEGFAFLTGRIRQKLDDELPELTDSMMELLWPHYLRPVPSFSILEIDPIKGVIRKKHTIAKGAQVESVPVDGTPCSFRTCFDVDIFPISLKSAVMEDFPGEATILKLDFKMVSGANMEEVELDKVRLFLTGENRYLLYLWLCNYVSKVTLKAGGQSARINNNIKPAGFGKHESIIPYSATSFDGHRMLHEYFVFPEKFMFIDFEGVEPFSEMDCSKGFSIEIEFLEKFTKWKRISKEDFKLFCTPVVNIFELDADPIRVNNKKTEYIVRPACRNIEHFEIFNVEEVSGWINDRVSLFKSFFSFEHSVGDKNNANTYYCTKRKEALGGDGSDIYISFVTHDFATESPRGETFGVKLLCTNRSLTEKLMVGDICVPTATSPEFVKFRNITGVTQSISPKSDSNLYWRLISHMSVNHVSTGTPEGLKGILELYNFKSFQDFQSARANERRINGVAGVDVESERRLMESLLVCGVNIKVALQEDHYSDEGDMYLFASILDEFYSLSATINSFTRLSVTGEQLGKSYEWPVRIGKQVIL